MKLEDRIWHERNGEGSQPGVFPALESDEPRRSELVEDMDDEERGRREMSQADKAEW